MGVRVRDEKTEDEEESVSEGSLDIEMRRRSLTDLMIAYRVQGPAVLERVVRAIKRTSPQLRREEED